MVDSETGDASESVEDGRSVSLLIKDEVQNEDLDPHKPPSDNNNIDNYQILSELGAGGMGVVYKAKRQGVDNTLAIKMLHPKLVLDEANIRRFEHEAKAASCLTHPHLVAVYDFGFTEKREPYLVMDYVEGESLSSIIASEHSIAPQRCINIFLQVCEALSHAHAKQIIHRDLKPNNIMLSKVEGSDADFVKIVDFGIAQLLPNADTERERLTQTGELIGSPVYMSPEQCLGNALDARSDIYTVGCTMYEALCGRPPLLKDNVVQTILAHLNDLPQPLKNVPEELGSVVMRCLEKNPAHRYQTVEELKEALEMVHSSTLPWRKKILESRISQWRIRSLLKRFEKRGFIALAACTAITGIAWMWYSQATADTTLNQYMTQAKLSDLQLDLQNSRNNWTRAIAEAERLKKPRKLIADLHNRLGDTYLADTAQTDRSLANQQFEIALANLEATHTDISDRIQILNKLTTSSAFYGQMVGTVQPTRLLNTTVQSPDEIFRNLVLRDLPLKTTYTRAITDEQLAQRKYVLALSILSQFSDLPAVNHRLNRACAGLSEQMDAKHALQYLLPVWLLKPNPEIDRLVNKYSAAVDNPALPELLRKLDTALTEANFSDVQHYSALAKTRTNLYIFDQMSTRAAWLLSEHSQNSIVKSSNVAGDLEQIKWREMLLKLNAEVLPEENSQRRDNVRALAVLYVKVGKHPADAQRYFEYLIKTAKEPSEECRCWLPLMVSLMQQNKYKEAYQVSQYQLIDRRSGNPVQGDYPCDRSFLAIEAANKIGLKARARQLSGELLGFEIQCLQGATSGTIGPAIYIPHDADFLP
jgi:serine/threonine protein kinase